LLKSGATSMSLAEYSYHVPWVKRNVTISGMGALELDLHRSLLDLYEKWLTIGYHAARFGPMLDRKGPLSAVKHLLAGRLKERSGFIRLARAVKLQWTVEYLLCSHRRWKLLFTELELEKARSRYDTARLLIQE
jgi:hypothetical protein